MNMCVQVVFSAGSVIIAMHAVASGRQRFFLGHTAHVVALAFDAEGCLLASAQEGRPAVVRLWDFASATCVAVLSGEWEGHGTGDAAAVVASCSCQFVGLYLCHLCGGAKW